MSSQLRVNFLTSIYYARAFFVTPPDESPLMPGETRNFLMYYARGTYEGTAFGMVWYANKADSDAETNPLTDTERLPTAVFTPQTPDADAEVGELQYGEVRLTAPAANGYSNPVGVIEITEDTGDIIQPRIYLLQDTIEIPRSVAYIDYDFRYTLGNPKINAFYLEWYANRLDAKRMLNKLTETDRLPRVDFFPSTPNRSADAETLLSGKMRVYRPVSDMPYTSAYGQLCVTQDMHASNTKESEIDIASLPKDKRIVRPKWENY